MISLFKFLGFLLQIIWELYQMFKKAKDNELIEKKNKVKLAMFKAEVLKDTSAIEALLKTKGILKDVKKDH